MPAGTAENTGNTEGNDLVGQPEFTGVTAIPDQRTGVSAGTGDLSQINRKNDIIIKFLRNRVA